MSSNENADLQGSAGEKQLGGIGKIPFYLVCDESGSMAGAPIDAVNRGLADIYRNIARDPSVDDKALIGVIAFQNIVEVLVPLSSTTETATIPSCKAGGGTSYKAVFVKLKEQIQEDVSRIQSLGHAVGRPIVYFMSDGRPNNERWQEAHAALVEPDDKINPFRPHIISFGVGDAQADVIDAVATVVDRFGTRFSFLAKDGISADEALVEVLQLVCSSIVASAREGKLLIDKTEIGKLKGVIEVDKVRNPNA